MYVSRDGSDSGDGAMIGILAVVAALALVGSIGWAVVFGGVNPPSDPAAVYGPPQTIGVPSTAVAPGKP